MFNDVLRKKSLRELFSSEEIVKRYIRPAEDIVLRKVKVFLDLR